MPSDSGAPIAIVRPESGAGRRAYRRKSAGPRLRYLSISPTYRATATTRDIVCG